MLLELTPSLPPNASPPPKKLPPQGYNHFVGRLGMRLPETARLLSRYPVDYYEFCWGSCTLTHADTARALWRPGVTRGTLCKGMTRPFIEFVDPADEADDYEDLFGTSDKAGGDGWYAKGGWQGQGPLGLQLQLPFPGVRVELPGITQVQLPNPIGIVGSFFSHLFGR